MYLLHFLLAICLDSKVVLPRDICRVHYSANGDAIIGNLCGQVAAFQIVLLAFVSQLFITGVLLQVCDSELFCFLFILFSFGNRTHTCMMTDCVAFSTIFLSKVKYFFIPTQFFWLIILSLCFSLFSIFIF
jgi:hypothetical protein